MRICIGDGFFEKVAGADLWRGDPTGSKGAAFVP